MHLLLMLMLFSASQNNHSVPENLVFISCCYQRDIPHDEPIEETKFSPVGIAEIAEPFHYPADQKIMYWAMIKAPQNIICQVVPPG